MKNKIVLQSFMVMILICPHVWGEEIYTSFFSNDALKGYDAVAYFTESKPVKGTKHFSIEYLGATWLFESESNKQLFVQNPEKYRPQYGGYCAWAVAEKHTKAPGDPLYWRIVEGKLYLNYDADIQKLWLKDIPGFIRSANKNWPDVKKQ